MDFDIIRDKRNELLNRREIRFRIRYDGATPSRMQITGKICALLNTKEQLLTLDSLKSSFGRREIAGEVRIYDTEEGRKRTERAHLAARGMPKAEKEKAA